jgi:citrate lyase synthetase
MKRWVNVLSQIALGAAQVFNIFVPILKPNTRIVAAGGMAAAQLVISAIAHEYNPDGTTAKVAYTPKNGK